MKRYWVLLLLAAGAGWAQEEATRQLWNTEFLQKRPPGKTPARPKVTYKPLGDGAKAAVADPGAGVMLGVTLWRLRPEKSHETGARLLVLLPNGDKRAEVPERVDAGTPLKPGDEVRLTVEVPYRGYMYVVDREQYSDGSVSDPYLIYPNWQTRPGDNVVAPGRLLEIPDRRDEVKTFTIVPKRKDQSAELLSILVTPEPLPNLKIGKEALALDKAQYAEWEKNWGVKGDKFELESGSGTAWTDKESKAGEGAATLTQDDPLPQTLIRVHSKPGNAILLDVPLQIKH